MFARSPEERRTTLAALRASLPGLLKEEIGGPAPTPAQSAPITEVLSSSPLASGWPEVDAALPAGGLISGELAYIAAPPGHGAVSLASSWVRNASRNQLATLVVEASDQALPHPWVEPEDARAPIWIAVPAHPGELWPIADLGLRSGSFGLVVLLPSSPGSPLPPAPPSTGPRLRRLLKEHGSRVLCLGAPPLRAQLHIDLRTTEISWVSSPVGDAPQRRQIEARCTAHSQPNSSPAVHRSDDTLFPHRLCTPERVADRSASPKRVTKPRGR